MRSERFHCHDEKQLTAAVTRLEAAQPRQIMILAGPAGIGRHHFLHTVASRLTQRGKLARVVPLSLEGYDPIGPGLPAFVAFRMEFGAHNAEALSEPVAKLMERIGAQDPKAAGDGRWAVCFALLFGMAS